MNKKILFIQPTIYDDEGKLLKRNRLYFVGLAHPLLSALLPEGWSSEICLEAIEEIPWDTAEEALLPVALITKITVTAQTAEAARLL